jgi:hypothetical protein
MAQNSGFWTTEDISPVGHQVTGYTQSHWSTALEIMAASSGFEGVAPGYLNNLDVINTDLNEVTVDAGGALVDGKWYINDAGEILTVESASGSGNTRIDRIVIRVDWSSYIAQIHRIVGVAAASPSPPDIAQNSGSVYDIKLAQLWVDEYGNITVVDERDWSVISRGPEFGFDGGQLILAEDSVANSKLADPVDTVYLKVLGDQTPLSIADGLMSFYVPNRHNGKKVVRTFVGIHTPSTNGDTTIRIHNVDGAFDYSILTIAQGSLTQVGTNPNSTLLNAGEKIRIDCTAVGDEVTGLDVYLEVDKS